VKIDEGQQKIKIVRTNRQSNLWVSCQSIFSLRRHHPTRQQLGKIDGGTTKNKNRPHQPTIKFMLFLPINFLPLLAPP